MPMSRSMSRPVILWDAMDTLVRDPFRDAMPGFFSMTLPEMLAAKHPTAWSRFELGELTEQEFLATFFRDPRPFDTEAFRACVRNAYAWVDGMQDLLAEVRAGGADMHVLSNYPEWYLWIEERLRVSAYAAWTFVSCRTKVRKPDPEAFLRAARHLEVETSVCLFVDDRAGNCDAARAAGMPAIHFEGDVGALRERLRDHGLV
jgi:FMN hydrolase / 5-amino-6-(5-phospho-D-ribitylamino)uracil phosphatase